MQYTITYSSPLGPLLLAADAQGLTGLWFQGEKFFADGLDPAHASREVPVLASAARWLDLYFSGREPDFSVPLHPCGTPFQLAVWQRLREIPYGETVTYGQIAKELAAQRGMARLAAQAVGGAVGRNKISILIPCHRVLGAGGKLTGYAAGLPRKQALLRLEGALPEE